VMPLPARARNNCFADEVRRQARAGARLLFVLATMRSRARKRWPWCLRVRVYSMCHAGQLSRCASSTLRVYPDRHWLNPFADGTPSNPSGSIDLAWTNVAGGFTDIDARIWMFTDYYSISPGMVSQTPGAGAKYMIAFTDSTGAPLSGGASYHLKLPPNVPAANFWSLTLYEAENASGYANGQPFPSLGSRDKPEGNADRTTDLYLGPNAPPGKERNWMKTIPGRGYFTILRLYSPTQAAIDKSWKPADIEKMN
jgi:hypothetical protein